MRVLIVYCNRPSRSSLLMREALVNQGHEVVMCNLGNKPIYQGTIGDVVICDDSSMHPFGMETISAGPFVVPVARIQRDRHHKRDPQPNRGPIGRKQWS